MPIVESERMTDITSSSSFRYSDAPQDDFDTQALLGTSYETVTSYRSSRQSNRVSEYEELSGPDLYRNVGHEYRRRFDNGNEFSSFKRMLEFDHLNEKITLEYNPAIWNDKRIEINGFYAIPLINSPELPPMSAPESVDLDVLGAKAFNKAKPTTPEADLATFLGELKEGLPSVVGHAAIKGSLSPKSIGGEHLNYQFGIAPTVGDLKKLTRGVKQFHRKVKQLQRDSGRNIRRKVSLGSDTTMHDNIFSKNNWPVLMSAGITDDLLVSHGRVTVFDVVKTETWFSGAFSYHLAEGHSFLDKLERYEQLCDAALGTRFDADTAWELTPWSWVIDWFADVGTFISNVTALQNDNLVLRYGYVMRTEKVLRVIRVEGMEYRSVAAGNNFDVIPTPSTSCSAFITETTKIRRRASPYGFGVDFGTLNPRRISILGALGMTKSPENLRLRT